MNEYNEKAEQMKREGYIDVYTVKTVHDHNKK